MFTVNVCKKPLERKLPRNISNYIAIFYCLWKGFMNPYIHVLITCKTLLHIFIFFFSYVHSYCEIPVPCFIQTILSSLKQCYKFPLNVVDNSIFLCCIIWASVICSYYIQSNLSIKTTICKDHKTWIPSVQFACNWTCLWQPVLKGHFFVSLGQSCQTLSTKSIPPAQKISLG